MKRNKKGVVFQFAIDGDDVKVRKQQARPATAHKDKTKYSRKSKYRGDHPEQTGGPFVFGLAAWAAASRPFAQKTRHAYEPAHWYRYPEARQAMTQM